MRLYQGPPNQSYLVCRASVGAPGKDILPSPRRVRLLYAGSRVTFLKSVKMLIRIAFWSSQVLPSGRTEVLTKGGTGFLGASRAWKVCPGGLPLLCLTMDERFHKRMMILTRFFNPKWGEPKYSIRVVPERTEVLNRGGTHV